MSRRKKISILYPYFFPGYKAGGITQSLYNLSVILNQGYTVQIVCLNHDFCDSTPYVFENDSNVQSIAENVTAVYLEKNSFFSKGYKAIKQFNPDFIYVNSVYNAGFLSMGLYASKKLDKELVIAPRGMLHSGGLQKGTVKKQLYLKVLKSFLPKNKLSWHATDEQELLDIKKWFGNYTKVFKATDTPRPITTINRMPAKADEVLKLVYYSLITSKKNLLLLLQALAFTKNKVKLDIFGPVVEPEYWQECLHVIKLLPSNIQVEVKGNVLFKSFAENAHHYHFLVLPSKGENFGHVIYEGLSLALPVIVSKFTPWNFKDGETGYFVDLNTQSISTIIDKAAALSINEYEIMSKNARNFAFRYYDETMTSASIQYQSIFPQ